MTARQSKRPSVVHVCVCVALPRAAVTLFLIRSQMSFLLPPATNTHTVAGNNNKAHTQSAVVQLQEDVKSLGLWASWTHCEHMRPPLLRHQTRPPSFYIPPPPPPAVPSEPTHHCHDEYKVEAVSAASLSSLSSPREMEGGRLMMRDSESGERGEFASEEDPCLCCRNERTNEPAGGGKEWFSALPLHTHEPPAARLSVVAMAMAMLLLLSTLHTQREKDWNQKDQARREREREEHKTYYNTLGGRRRRKTKASILFWRKDNIFSNGSVCVIATWVYE